MIKVGKVRHSNIRVFYTFYAVNIKRIAAAYIIDGHNP